MSKGKISRSGMYSALALICATLTGIIGYTINNSRIGISIVDGLFWPIVWCKWLICHDVNMSKIHDALGFLLN